VEENMSRNYINKNQFTSDKDGSSASSPKRDVYTDKLKNNPVISRVEKVKGLQYNTKTGKLEKK